MFSFRQPQILFYPLLKRSLGVALIVLVSSWAMAQQRADSAPAPTLNFVESTYEFGDMIQGDTVSHIFTFENTGNAPLVLTNVATTCGCTAPEWPREPVFPGETAQLRVAFDSKGKAGRQIKIITVFSNASNSREKLTITANVLPPESSGQ